MTKSAGNCWAPLALLLLTVVPAQAQSSPALAWSVCQLEGVTQEARCGSLKRPLDPARPLGPQIDVHFALLPAVARIKKPDALVVLAGGPGQSAISLAGPLSRQWSRALNRRDLLLLDQRGTGRSAPLDCERDSPTAPLAQSGAAYQLDRLMRCKTALQKRPHGDLRFYTTSIAMADLEAVRVALGWGPINVVGASYGTRAALEYQRLYPAVVRRSVLDGVAPPDMVLPQSIAVDAQASWQALLKSCEDDSRCREAHGPLRDRWLGLLNSLPREVEVTHPIHGRRERLLVTRDMLTSWIRLPLYVPALAAGLPHAVAEASQGRWEALVGLASSFGSGRQSATRLAEGMHFSVVCSEDMPRVRPDTVESAGELGAGALQLYERICADWPRGLVSAEFYRVVPARSAVLLLSGGVDPATPPRHGQSAAKALGPLARHVEVPQAGHGVLALACMPDAVQRFLDAEDDATALSVDMSCAQQVPRPRAFVPVDRLDAEGRRLPLAEGVR
jgi:pimeloyl-ACP methyl ester carboxylesterase